jgi:cobalt-zinc-cadmium efflux system outer membrane protein
VKRFLAFLPLIGAASCVPAAVDYGALRDAAETRHRQAGISTTPGGDVNALLSRPLTADSAAQVALLNNQGTRAALEELGIAEADSARARRLPNPTLEGAMRFDGDGTPALDVAAMIDLTELVMAFPRGDAADAKVRAAKLGAVGSLLDLSFEARRAFFEYQAARQALDLRTTVLRALAASADAAKRLHEAGNITNLDLANEQSLFQEARLSLQRAETTASGARERLNAIMGLWGRGTEWRATDRLPEMPGEELAVARLESDAVRRSLDLEMAGQRFTAAARRANISRVAGWIPELKAGVSAEREDQWSIGPAVEIEVPLFYQGQGEVRAAHAEMRQQQAVYTDTAVRLRAEARDVAARLGSAREAVAYYRDVLLPLKQKIVAETQLQYNGMLVGVFQLLQAKRDQVETAAAYIAELANYWSARTDAERLLAGRLGGRTSDAKRGMEGVGASAPRRAEH